MNGSLNFLSKAIIKKKIFSNLKSFKDLEKRIENIKSLNKRTIEQTKGDIFEIFVEALLNVNKKYKAKKIYPTGRIPFTFLKLLELNRRDKGADGIYTSNNENNTYQVKYRDKNSNLTWSELSNFIGVSEKASYRHLFTNTNKISSEFLSKKRIRITSRNDFLRLKSHEFAEIDNWLNSKPQKLKRHKPEKYQRDAIKNILNELSLASRATAIMACGSGKTNIGLWVYEKLLPKLSVIFVPSIALIKQIRADWLEQISIPNLSTIQICSSKDSTNREDELKLTDKDIDFKITTDLKEVKKFLNSETSLPKIIFCTYQSSPILVKALKNNKQIDFGIFDEAHRTARVNKQKNKEFTSFNIPLYDKYIPIKKRLFFTATRRISNINKINKEGEAKVTLSMENTELYGKVCHKLSFTEAAKLGCIAKFKIILSEVTSTEIEKEKRKISNTLIKNTEIKTDQVAKQIAVKKAVEKFKINKIFSFHKSVPRAISFVKWNSAEGIKNHLPDFYCNHIEGSMRLINRESNMEEFTNSSKGILSNYRCLIEGVDVPSMEMVVFADNKNSEIDIVQAAGRALRNREGKKKYGYIMLPIFIEKHKNESMSVALERTNFDNIAEILKAMKEHDDEIAQIISEVNSYDKNEKGYRDKVSKKLSEIIEGINPQISKRILFNKIKNKAVDKITTKWDEMLIQLRKYIRKNGHSLTPIVRFNYIKKELSNDEIFYQWLHKIKIRFRKNKILNFQISELEKIGINWKIKGETLHSIEGLKGEIEVSKIIPNIGNLKKRGVIKPHGYYFLDNGLSNFYTNQQINELKKTGYYNYFKIEDKNHLTINKIIGRKSPPDSDLYNFVEGTFRKLKIKESGHKMIGKKKYITFSRNSVLKFNKFLNLCDFQKYPKMKIITTKPFNFIGCSTVAFDKLVENKKIKSIGNVFSGSTKKSSKIKVEIIDEKEFYYTDGGAKQRRLTPVFLIKDLIPFKKIYKKFI